MYYEKVKSHYLLQQQVSKASRLTGEKPNIVLAVSTYFKGQLPVLL